MRPHLFNTFPDLKVLSDRWGLLEFRGRRVLGQLVRRVLLVLLDLSALALPESKVRRAPKESKVQQVHLEDLKVLQDRLVRGVRLALQDL